MRKKNDVTTNVNSDSHVNTGKFITLKHRDMYGRKEKKRKQRIKTKTLLNHKYTKCMHCRREPVKSTKFMVKIENQSQNFRKGQSENQSQNDNNNFKKHKVKIKQKGQTENQSQNKNNKTQRPHRKPKSK